MSSFWINLNYYDKYPHDRKAKGDSRQKEKIHKEKTMWRQRQRSEGYCHHQGTVGATRSWQRHQRILFWSLQRGHGPTNLDFRLLASKLQETTSLLFKATKCVITCHSSPRKLIQMAISSLWQELRMFCWVHEQPCSGSLFIRYGPELCYPFLGSRESHSQPAWLLYKESQAC